MQMIYFKEDYATITLDETFNAIQLEWHGFILSHDYRDTMNLALHLVEEKKLTRWLANMKDMGKIQLQDAKWREEIWFPRFVESTIEKVAVVVSTDYFNELAIKETIKEVDKKSKILRRRFTDPQQAEAWLKEEHFFYPDIASRM
jgi:hypothetical protein